MSCMCGVDAKRTGRRACSVGRSRPERSAASSVFAEERSARVVAMLEDVVVGMGMRVEGMRDEEEEDDDDKPDA